MNITLPKDFSYKGKMCFIENEVLKIQKNADFERVMYALTYALKNSNQCFYCSKRLECENATLDHLYPQYTGGITIPNNLEISCPECNVQKGCMTENQYKKWLLLEEKEQKIYLDKIKKLQEKNFNVYGFNLPNRWTIEIDVSKINSRYKSAKRFKGEKYYKVERFYRKHKRFPRPIIVDRNYYLLNGAAVYCFALYNKKKKVPTIILENVEII